jgi:uncharacterized protein YjaZ
MGKLNLFIANANNKFTDKELAIFKNAKEAAQDFISKNFDFDYDVDVIVTEPSFLASTIPEDGIVGKTYNSQLVILVVDKQQAAISEDSVFETICHEMSHALRWEKLSEYSNTLFKGMILEGLAVALEEKAINDTGRSQKQFFLKEIQSTDQAAIDSMIANLRDLFDNENYDYNTVFFTGNDVLPRWAGYRLGYYFVKKQLQESDMTIEKATLASYDDFRL